MANPEHLEILKQGVKVWNQWRLENPEIRPDISGANLDKLELIRYDFKYVNFRKASFERADLSVSDLTGADLADANLLITNVDYTNFYSATFVRANLKYAKFTSSIFDNADLRNTICSGTVFSLVSCKGVNFEGAIFGSTALVNADLNGAIGLESCIHLSPSMVDYHTLALSGRLPLTFLRGCGLPDTYIEYLPSLLNDPLQYYSCFISYSSKDQDFADRLYTDLQNKGVRCWFAPEDLKIGEKIRIRIDESIRFHDKLLLVLSKQSIASDWVEQEVETALDRERKEKRTVLFPIRLDDTVMKIDTGWPALIKNTRNIGDFRKWKNQDSYQKAFNRLLRDLKAEDKNGI
jgi:uncharacterized protein YjbI with pentapeptide repeats